MTHRTNFSRVFDTTPAAGCTPDINEANYQEYSSYFWAALRGKTRTGEPIFRYHFSFGGVNSSVVLHNNDKLIAIHGKENVDTSEVGRMVAISVDKEPAAGEPGG